MFSVNVDRVSKLRSHPLSVECVFSACWRPWLHSWAHAHTSQKGKNNPQETDTKDNRTDSMKGPEAGVQDKPGFCSMCDPVFIFFFTLPPKELLFSSAPPD